MNHSHGYEVRLQTARELRRETAEANRKVAAKKLAARDAFERLACALNALEELPATLAAYEATGNHDHSFPGRSRPIAPGAPCPGGDCLVAKARKIIAALEG